MVRKIRAGQVKTALYEITRDLVSKGSYSAEKAVAEFKSKHDSKLKAEVQDVLDFGLMALAGRVRTQKGASSDQGDLLEKWKIREFITLVIQKDGKRRNEVFNNLNLTVGVWDSRVERVKNGPTTLSGDKLIAVYMEEMRQKGFTKTLGEYLKDRE